MSKGLHGLPTFILQDECKTPISTEWYQGTLKADVQKNDPGCKGLAGVSFYDRKPIHFLYMSIDSLEFTNKERMVYCNAHKNMVRLDFLKCFGS